MRTSFARLEVGVSPSSPAMIWNLLRVFLYVVSTKIFGFCDACICRHMTSETDSLSSRDLDAGMKVN